jgi:hypothetical protein
MLEELSTKGCNLTDHGASSIVVGSSEGCGRETQSKRLTAFYWLFCLRLEIRSESLFALGHAVRSPAVRDAVRRHLLLTANMPAKVSGQKS